MILPRLRRRPILLLSVLAGVLGAVVAHLLGAEGVSAGLAGWDVTALAYAGAVLVTLWGDSPGEMERQAARLDQDRWTILLLAIIASLASLVAVGADLAIARGTPRAGGAAALAGATVLLSWGFVQVLFAQHYAHEHWLHGKGLAFPGNDRPDFPEFLYFSMTVGMTAQVSDVTTATAAMRRLVLAHAALAFLFNAVVVAAAVNLAAALVG